MKIYGIRVISLFLLILTMAIIFTLSADTGEESGDLSEEVTEKILGIFGVDEEDYSAGDYEQIKDRAEGITRKCAHFLEYAWLGAICYIFFWTYEWKRLKTAALSLAVCVLYAALDEWHQSFVPGRGPGIKDVMIDSSGVVFGIFFVILMSFLVSRYINRGKSKTRVSKK